MTASRPTSNPPWLIGLANIIPNGNGLNAAIPFILRKAGLSLPEIATVTSVLLIPSFTFFLWTPVVEFWITRRQWWMVSYGLGAVLQFFALAQPLPSHLVSFTLLQFLANVALFTPLGILSPLVRDTVSENRHGEVGAWIYCAGIVSAASTGAFVWLAEATSRSVLSVSPDGKFLAYPYSRSTNTQAAGWNLAVIPSGGGPPVATFKLSTEIRNPRWSPDGRGVDYLLTRDAVTNLWEQPLGGGKAKQLTKFTTGHVFDFNWSADRSRLLFTRGSMSSNVILLQRSR